MADSRWLAARGASAALILSAGLLALTVHHAVRGQVSCEIEQITTGSEAGGNIPSISGAGDLLALQSFGDWVPGENPDLNREIFLYDTTWSSFTQITRTTTAQNFSPALSADGSSVAFESDGDLVAGGNPDRSMEIFFYEVAAHSLAQVTRSAESSSSAALSADGRYVAFSSRGDHVPGQNSEKGTQIFLYDRLLDTFEQITKGQFTSFDPSLSASGNRIVFSSNGDFANGLNSDRNREIFLYDRRADRFTQLTESLGGPPPEQTNTWPRIDGKGSRIIFTSRADLVPGGNPDHNLEVFLYDEGVGLQQLTRTMGQEHSTPVISADGERVVYGRSPDDWTQDLLLHDLSLQLDTRLTAAPGRWSQAPSLNGDGTRIAFASDADLVPGGNMNRILHVYVATCRRTSVFLHQGRFRVEVDWRTGDGTRGEGTGLTFSEQTAYFWFFDPGNIELLVKVLDGCQTSFASYWVFAGGLTNVEVDLRITDTRTGATKAYFNPLDNDFPPTFDVAAFDTCSSPQP